MKFINFEGKLLEKDSFSSQSAGYLTPPTDRRTSSLFLPQKQPPICQKTKNRHSYTCSVCMHACVCMCVCVC